MSTRGLIAIEKTDKTCLSIYCHFDCYIEGAGRILIEHYKTLDRVEALLELGSLSALGERLAPETGEEHSYDSPADGICIAYHRDRGEPLQPATIWANAEEMLDNAADRFWAEYCYLFRNGKWYVDACYKKQGWKLVDDVLREHDDEKD